jgi:hypothetical protein
MMDSSSRRRLSVWWRRSAFLPSQSPPSQASGSSPTTTASPTSGSCLLVANSLRDNAHHRPLHRFEASRHRECARATFTAPMAGRRPEAGRVGVLRLRSRARYFRADAGFANPEVNYHRQRPSCAYEYATLVCC